MPLKRTGEESYITSIKKGKKISLFLSSGDSFSVSPDTFVEFRLYEGKALKAKEIKEIKDFENQSMYYSFSLSCLAKKAYTVHELYVKLENKGASEAEIKAILSRLSRQGLLDDGNYAKAYYEDVSELKLFGYEKALFDLREKRVKEDILFKIKEDGEFELEKAKRLCELLNKRYQNLPTREKRRKMNQTLREKGFGEDVASTALNQTFKASSKENELSSLTKAYGLAKARYQRKYEGYELKKRLMGYLLSKGFAYEDIISILEEGETA